MEATVTNYLNTLLAVLATLLTSSTLLSAATSIVA